MLVCLLAGLRKHWSTDVHKIPGNGKPLNYGGNPDYAIRYG